jgi:proteasome assembly chaperone (PAC2) family protein
LALAKEYGLDGICLLGATEGFQTDKDAGLLAFRFLMKSLGKEIKRRVTRKTQLTENTLQRTGLHDTN